MASVADAIAGLAVDVRATGVKETDAALKGLESTIGRVEDKTGRLEKIQARKARADEIQARQIREVAKQLDLIERAFGRNALQVLELAHRMDDLERQHRAVAAATGRTTTATTTSTRATQAATAAQRQMATTVATADAALRANAAAHGLAAGAATRSGAAAAGASGGFSRMGSVIQQVGFQVGDFAVQVASGSGVLRPLIQQGTQMISMFGPWGAVVGAAGAVVGVLATSLLDVGNATDDTAKAMDAYRASLAATTTTTDAAERASRELAAARRDEAVAAIEAALTVESEMQRSLRAQIEFQQQNIRILRNVPSRLPELQAAEFELATLTRQFDASTDRADGLNSRLAILRDTLKGVERQTGSAATAQGQHTGVVADYAAAVDTALDRLELQIVANDNAITTWGREAEAIARVEAEQAIMNAARADGVQLTDEQRERMVLLLDQYEQGERQLRGLKEAAEAAENAQREATARAADAARENARAATEFEPDLPVEVADDFNTLVSEALS